jgi:hypothetical protein
LNLHLAVFMLLRHVAAAAAVTNCLQDFRD